MNPSFSFLTGFTTEEVRENFMDVVNVYCKKDYVEYEDIESRYAGYRFSNLMRQNDLASLITIIQHFDSMLKIFMEIKEKKHEKNMRNFFHYLCII